MRWTPILTTAVLMTSLGCENASDRNSTTKQPTNPPPTPSRTTPPTPPMNTPPSSTPPRSDSMNRPAPPSTPSTPTPAPSPSNAPSASPIAEVDRTFIMDAANGNLFEVQSAQWVIQQPGIDDQTKRAAQMIVDDHTKANNDLKAIAQRKGVTMPTTVSPKQQQQLDQIKSATGANVDDKFVAIQIQAHKDTIEMFEDSVTTLKDPELRAFAQKCLPTLRKHLEQLQSAQPAETP